MASIRNVTLDLADLQGVLKHRGVSCCIDWLAYSVEWSKLMLKRHRLGLNETRLRELAQSALEVALMPSERFMFTGEYVPNSRGYSHTLALNFGALKFHAERPEQKIGVEFRGADLMDYRRVGFSELQLLADVIGVLSGKVSRLDVAIDHFGGSEVLDLREAANEGRLQSKARAFNVFNGNELVDGKLKGAGATVYVGAPSSDRQLVVYDKGYQLIETSGHWARLELRLHGDRAVALASQLVAFRDTWLDVARAAVRDFCQVEGVGWWDEATRGPVVELLTVGRRDTDTDRWLREQVFPTLSRRLREQIASGDWSLYDAVQNRLDDLLVDYSNRADYHRWRAAKRGEIAAD